MLYFYLCYLVYFHLAVAYPTLTDAYNALHQDNIQGVLVDSYAAGSLRELQTQDLNTYVNRVIGKSISYGLVLSGKLTRLAPACRDYIKKNQALISKIISQHVKPIEVWIQSRD